MIGGGGCAAAATDSAPTVAPLESRISRDMCNTSRYLAAPCATASNTRTPQLYRQQKSFPLSSCSLCFFQPHQFLIQRQQQQLMSARASQRQDLPFPIDIRKTTKRAAVEDNVALKTAPQRIRLILAVAAVIFQRQQRQQLLQSDGMQYV